MLNSGLVHELGAAHELALSLVSSLRGAGEEAETSMANRDLLALYNAADDLASRISNLALSLRS